jgi:hypothetical protein
MIIIFVSRLTSNLIKIPSSPVQFVYGKVVVLISEGTHAQHIYTYHADSRNIIIEIEI